MGKGDGCLKIKKITPKCPSRTLQNSCNIQASQTFTRGNAGNYAITYSDGVLSISQRPITVQANALSRSYGSTNPTTDAVSLTAGSLANGPGHYALGRGFWTLDDAEQAREHLLRVLPQSWPGMADAARGVG